MLKRMTAMLVIMFCLCNGADVVLAETVESLGEGSYTVEAELSCYVNAMGGVEFGAPLLTSAKVNVAADGSRTMTLSFTKSNVTIYSVSCDTFIDANPSYVTESNGVKSGTIGYYDASGVLVTDGVVYTLSEDTALNARQEQVHYVDSITFPLTGQSNTYQLSLYVNSNVMGTQFTMEGYPAVLTVDWSQMDTDAYGENNSTESDDAEQTTAVESAIPSETTQKEESLNLYPADGTNETDETNVTDEKPESAEAGKVQTPGVETTAASTVYKPVLAGTSAVAVVMILMGTGLIILGRKEKKKCEN